MLLVYEVQVAVTKTTHALAKLALVADDHHTALWARTQGHLATPELSLFDWQIRAGRRPRDLDGLNLAFGDETIPTGTPSHSYGRRRRGCSPPAGAPARP